MPQKAKDVKSSIFFFLPASVEAGLADVGLGQAKIYTESHLTISNDILMTHLLKILFFMSLVLLAGCTQGDGLETVIQQVALSNAPTRNRINKKEALQNYIKHNHQLSSSRTIIEELQPILCSGDTVAYVMNFENGWELYSNSVTMPILLMKSESSQFDVVRLKSNPPFCTLWESSKHALRQEMNDPLAEAKEGSEMWDLYGLAEENFNNSPQRKPVPRQSFAVGQSTHDESETIEHLTSTKWHQRYPYNEYCPYVNDSHSHALAGCGAIAAAQFLYYSHYTWNAPSSCVTTGYYDKATNTYSFHNENEALSNSLWDDMPLHTYYDTTPALLIGYAGKQMNTKFGTDSINQPSSTPVPNFISFLNNHVNISIHRNYFSAENVYNSIKNTTPLRI